MFFQRLNLWSTENTPRLRFIFGNLHIRHEQKSCDLWFLHCNPTRWRLHVYEALTSSVFCLKFTEMLIWVVTNKTKISTEDLSFLLLRRLNTSRFLTENNLFYFQPFCWYYTIFENWFEFNVKSTLNLLITFFKFCSLISLILI